MTKPVITTRAGKGSALTWSEGDQNLTNLRDATVSIKAGSAGTSVVSDLNGEITLVAGTNITLSGNDSTKEITINASGGSGITDVVQDTTPQLGGNLDVNGYAIVSASNGHIDVTPNGTGNIRLTPASGKIVLGASDWPTGMGTNGQVLTTNGSGTLSWATSSGGITDVVQDTSPQLGGDLDVNSKAIVSVSNGNIRLEPNGTGNIQLTPASGKITLGALDWPTADGTANQVLKTNGSGTLSWTTISSSSGTVTSVSGTGTVNGLSLSGTVTSSGNLTLGGTLDLTTAPAIGSTSANTGAFTTLSASSTVSGTGFSTYLASPPAIGGTAAAAGTFTALTSTGAMSFKQPVEAIYDNGNSGAATITPNAANGSVQKYTLTGNITWNAFGTPVAGQSMTMMLIQDGTGSRTLTSTMKWAGGTKTLSTAASSIDIVTVYYDGTNYYASLAKGFA